MVQGLITHLHHEALYVHHGLVTLPAKPEAILTEKLKPNTPANVHLDLDALHIHHLPIDNLGEGLDNGIVWLIPLGTLAIRSSVHGIKHHAESGGGLYGKSIQLTLIGCRRKAMYMIL
jgi:hypothetical protein